MFELFLWVLQVALGAACGLAAAFHAPFAGTLFMIEEIASFFSKRFVLHVTESVKALAVTAQFAGTAASKLWLCRFWLCQRL